MIISMNHKVVSFIILFVLSLSSHATSQKLSKEYHFTDFSMEQFHELLSDFKAHEIDLASIQDLYGIALYNNLLVVNDKIDVYVNVRNQKIANMDFVVAGFIYQLKSMKPAYEKLIELDYAYVDELIYLNYKRSISSKLIEGLLVENGKVHKEILQDNQIIISEYHSNGSHAIDGAYDAANMYISDTIRIVDPETYITTYEVSIKLNPKAKVGTWKYYDSQGKLLREENH